MADLILGRAGLAVVLSWQPYVCCLGKVLQDQNTYQSVDAVDALKVIRFSGVLAYVLHWLHFPSRPGDGRLPCTVCTAEA